VIINGGAGGTEGEDNFEGTAEMDRCAHVFEIHNYILHKGLGPGKFIRSATFAVGGYECVRNRMPVSLRGGGGELGN
jgi:speckle-type POZ protein